MAAETTAAPAVALTPGTLAATERPVETYGDIVWKQFRRNLSAYASLWALVPLVGCAIFAPLLGSDLPLVFRDGDQTLYPWFRALFLTEEPVDFLFNMALIAFFPCAVFTLLMDRFGTPSAVRARTRIARALAVYLLATVALCAIFGPSPSASVSGAGAGHRLAQLGHWSQTNLAPWIVVLILQLPLWRRAGIPPGRCFLVAIAQLFLLPWLRPTASPILDLPAFAKAMAVWAAIPWLTAVVLEYLGRRHKTFALSGAGLTALVQFPLIFAALAAATAGPQLRPVNRYAQRSFSEEQLQSPQTKRGWYVLIPYGATQNDLSINFKKPGFRKESNLNHATAGHTHLLGTDNNGSDVLVRMMYGTRLAITMGFVAVGIYLTIGILVGSVAGYFGGWVDILVNRVIEVVLVFPSFFLILTLVALLGPSIWIIMFVIGITGWPTIARLIRGEVLKQRNADYVTAAQAYGFSHLRIIFRHILPNALSPALVAAPFGVANAILTEGMLSLLGFGVRPPAPSWGSLLKLAMGNYSYWWLVLFPGLAIFLTVTIFNLIGSGLRDAMDPRLRSTH